MPRTVLKVNGNNEPLPPHEQSILNSLVFKALCTEEIFSILNKVSETKRHDALHDAIGWCLTHDLVSDEE